MPETWRGVFSNPFAAVVFIALAGIALLPFLCLAAGAALMFPPATRHAGSCLLSAAGGFFTSYIQKASYDEAKARGGLG